MHITTFSKVQMNPLCPKQEEIRIEDIAHAQSLMTRANGHFPEFYSVGQHSIACAREAIARNYSSRVVLACLLHDGSEAYLSDITRPVKGELSEYRRIEKICRTLFMFVFWDRFLPTKRCPRSRTLITPAYIMNLIIIWEKNSWNRLLFS